MSSFGMHVMQKDDTIAHPRLEKRVAEAQELVDTSPAEAEGPEGDREDDPS